MRILRHKLGITDYQTVTTTGPLLSVAQSRTQPNTLIDLWAFDHDASISTAKGVYIVGTGNPMPDELETHWRRFIGTVVTPAGLVWHVFEGSCQ